MLYKNKHADDCLLENEFYENLWELKNIHSENSENKYDMTNKNEIGFFREEDNFCSFLFARIYQNFEYCQLDSRRKNSIQSDYQILNEVSDHIFFSIVSYYFYTRMNKSKKKLFFVIFTI